MKKTVSAQVYDSILNDVFSTRYKPGYILTERALIEEYGCSKTTVREALVALCRDNILRSIPRYGYEILRVERSEITDIIEFRYLLESGCLMRCIDQITPRHILRLQELNDLCSLSADSDDLWTHWDHNTAFHLELVGLAGNRYVCQQMKNAMDTLKRAYAQYYWGRKDQSCRKMDTRNHQDIINAVRAKDYEAARAALGRDLKDFSY